MVWKKSKIGNLAVCALLAALLSGAAAARAYADTTETLIEAHTTETSIAAEETEVEGSEAETEAGPSAPTEFAHLYTCSITDGSYVSLTGENEGAWSDPAYYDNYLYLFELKPYEDEIGDRTDYIAWITKGDALSFTVPLYLGTENDRLYSKFVVAVYDGTKYIPVSNTAYVTNPESLARYTEAYNSAQTKKGLLIQNTDSMVADAFDLGVSHVIVNLAFQQILGEGISYVYDGKTYNFNKELIETYDKTIRRLSEKSMTVSAVILNGWNDATPQLVYPGVTKQPEDSVFYYGFHASTKESYETMKAIASFLAERYSSRTSEYGKVSNWIIGNEINNQQWNYMGPMGIDQYVAEYARAFRVFYTAIKSTTSNARVFFSTDYNWMNDADGTTKYNAKDIIDVFADQTGAGGAMDWGLAYHPYSLPMTEPEFWDDAATGLIRSDASSPVINLSNLSALTDYMQNASLRSPSGAVRHIILSEQGFTSKSLTRGENEELQAAAIAYAYYIADSNPYIDAFIMSRQVDAPSEVNLSLMFGLWYCDMNQPNDIVPTTRKKAWQVYKYIDNRTYTLETTEFAKSIIGIEKWSDVVPNFKWKSQEN